MKEIDQEGEEKLRNTRQEFMDRIKAARNPAEKDKLLEDMGKKLKAAEAQIAEDKERAETQLQKMLKARQKKNLKQKVKGMSKDVDELEEQIDKLKQNIDADKAQVYAEQGSALGLLDQDVVVKKAKIANALDNAYAGFQSELTQVEREDIEIHRTQMAIEKEKELGAAEAEIDEEALKSNK